MNELPTSALQPKDAGHANSDRHYFLSTPDLGSTAFDLHDASEIIGDVLRYEFDISDFSIAVIQRSGGKGRFNFLATTHVRPEGIAQGHVIRERVQRLVNARVGLHYRPEGRAIAPRAAWLCSIALVRSFVANVPSLRSEMKDACFNCRACEPR